jgi:hypothetical protein
MSVLILRTVKAISLFLMQHQIRKWHRVEIHSEYDANYLRNMKTASINSFTP